MESRGAHRGAATKAIAVGLATTLLPIATLLSACDSRSSRPGGGGNSGGDAAARDTGADSSADGEAADDARGGSDIGASDVAAPDGGVPQSASLRLTEINPASRMRG